MLSEVVTSVWTPFVLWVPVALIVWSDPILLVPCRVVNLPHHACITSTKAASIYRFLILAHSQVGGLCVRWHQDLASWVDYRALVHRLLPTVTEIIVALHIWSLRLLNEVVLLLICTTVRSWADARRNRSVLIFLSFGLRLLSLRLLLLVLIYICWDEMVWLRLPGEGWDPVALIHSVDLRLRTVWSRVAALDLLLEDWHRLPLLLCSQSHRLLELLVLSLLCRSHSRCRFSLRIISLMVILCRRVMVPELLWTASTRTSSTLWPIWLIPGVRSHFL